MSIRAVSIQIAPELRRKSRKLRELPKKTHTKFVSETPVRSGNARRRTRLQGDTIVADYPYASRLEDGWSRQAPDGMSEPTWRWFVVQVRRIFGAP